MDTWADEEDGFLSTAGDFYNGRNYDLFAILANVRNGRGFAGIKTGGGFVPISEPRGIPTDASPQVARRSDGYGIDGHSHSWLTLREILEFDWTQVSHKQGYTGLRAYATWYPKKGRSPSSYSGGVFGNSVRYITVDDMDGLVKEWRDLDAAGRLAMERKHSSVYVLAEWDETYATAAGDEWWKQTVPSLLKMCGPLTAADDVRIVFFFDN